MIKNILVWFIVAALALVATLIIVNVCTTLASALLVFYGSVFGLSAFVIYSLDV